MNNKTIDPKWAWTRFAPSSTNTWDEKKVGHLYRRAGFGANPEQLREGVAAGLEKTLTLLLHGAKASEEFTKTSAHYRKILGEGADANAMMGWWLYVIMKTPHPLLEKMTIFWHNHFATSQAKVQHVGHMLGQNETLRVNALGNFRVMLQAISKDPAMLIWLDGVTSKKGKPNENYARELMELFSLGVGNYSEADIREAARSFTGWDVKKDKYYFNTEEYDAGTKHVFGKKGNFTGEQIVDLCLEKKVAARFVVGKLFRYFISETLVPDEALIEPLAETFRKNYDIAPVIETILRSNLFFSEHAYRTKLKSPIEYVMGVISSLSGKVNMIALAQSLENLGQKLFFPPSVKGWDGGEAWVNSNTLLLRNNLALALVSTEDGRFGNRCDPMKVVRKNNVALDDDKALVNFLVGLFFQGDIAPASFERLLKYTETARKQKYPAFWTSEDITEHRVRSICHLVLTQPEFQLN